MRRPQIEWELRSAQWVLRADQGHRLLAWGSWYRVDDEALAVLREDGLNEAIQAGRVLDFTRGPHCYVASAVAAPWAPPETLTHLLSDIKRANPDARSLCMHFEHGDGRRHWRQRVYH